MTTLIARLYRNDPSLTDLNLTFAGDFLRSDDWVVSNDLLRALHVNRTITSLSITIEQQEKNQGWSSNYWKKLLYGVGNVENLQKLKLVGFFDPTGRHKMPLDVLTGTLRRAPKLTELSLDHIGLGAENLSQFDLLKEAFATRASLTRVCFDKVYFCSQTMSFAWAQYAQLVSSIIQTPMLEHLELKALTKFYGRPCLSLLVLEELLSHFTLQRLVLQDSNIWGTGSAQRCSTALRDNQRLEHLQIRSCCIAGDGNSVLAGMDHNKSVKSLDLTYSSLHLEADALAQALETNISLESCHLTRARLGMDELAHHSNLCRILRAVKDHPAIRCVNFQGVYAYRNCEQELPADCVSEALSLAVDMVQRNYRIVECTVDHLPESSHTYAELNMFLGLNRARFWDLTDMNDRARWLRALEQVIDNASCIMYILSENPQLVF